MYEYDSNSKDNSQKPTVGDYILGSLPFVGSMASSILGFLSQSSANKQNQKNFNTSLAFNREMLDKQLSFQRDMYEDAKLYNSPANQAMLYTRAGLNPLSIMENGNAFAPVSAMSGGSASAPSAPNIQAYQPNFSGITEGVQSFINSRLNREQVRSLQYDNFFKLQQNKAALENSLQDLLRNKHLTRKEEYLADQEFTRLRLLNRTEDDVATQQHWEAKKSWSEFVQNDIENQFNKATYNLRYQLVENNVRLSRQQLSYVSAQMQKIYQEIENLVEQKHLTYAESQKVIQETNNLFQDYLIRQPKQHQSNHEMYGYSSSQSWLFDTLDDANRAVQKILGKYRN